MIPFRIVLESVNTTVIDLWSLDVEGAELQVLQSIDFRRVAVHVIIIERNHHDREIEQVLVKAGFMYLREQRGNRLWVNDSWYKQRRVD